LSVWPPCRRHGATCLPCCRRSASHDAEPQSSSPIVYKSRSINKNAIVLLFLYFNKRVVKEYCWDKYYTNSPSSKSNWSQSNDEIVSKCYRLNALQKAYFGFFCIEKTSRKTPFCNLSTEQSLWYSNNTDYLLVQRSPGEVHRLKRNITVRISFRISV